EETVESIQGISEAAIEQHEDFALFALISIIVLGLISLVGIYLSSKKSPNSSLLAKIILVLSLISFIIFARTGYLGGQIRHTEIGANVQTSTNTGVEH